MTGLLRGGSESWPGWGRAWPVIGPCLIAAGVFISYIRGVNTADEAWLLQVAERVLRGDVLYRDVFFGATPLSMYMILGPMRILGSEAIVLKALMAMCYAVTILITLRMAVHLGIGGLGIALLGAALAVYLLPLPHGAYKAVASVFLLLCTAAALGWTRMAGDGTRRPGIVLGVAGVAAGLGFASYQSLGMYAFAAVLLMVLAEARGGECPTRRRVGFLIAATAGFVATVAIVLIPVWASGSGSAFLDYGFLNKGTYLGVAGLPYLDQLSPALAFFREPSMGSFGPLFRHSTYLLPLLVGTLLARELVKSRGADRNAATLALFAAAGLAGAFPRVDWWHFAYSLPLLLLGLSYCLRRIQPTASFQRLILGALAFGWLLIGLASEIHPQLVRWSQGALVTSNLSHFKGMLFPSDQYVKLASNARELAAASAGKPLLLITSEAGFYYLAAGLQNPTPFDYPLVTAFGSHGEAAVVHQLELGEIRQVCMRTLLGTNSEHLRPALLEDYILENMVPVRELNACTLYARP